MSLSLTVYQTAQAATSGGGDPFTPVCGTPQVAPANLWRGFIFPPDFAGEAIYTDKTAV